MNNYPLRLLIVLCALLITSCTSNSEFELDQIEATEKISENPIEIEVLDLVNNHRVANGYATLDKLQAIKSQTNNHTNYMIEKEKISHDFFFERKEYLNKNVNSKNDKENYNQHLMGLLLQLMEDLSPLIPTSILEKVFRAKPEVFVKLPFLTPPF